MNDSFDPSRRRRAEHDRADAAARLQGGCHLVVLAAPPAVSEPYLDDLLSAPADLVAYVESPWFTTVARATRLGARLAASPVKVVFGDAYLARGAVRWLLGVEVLPFLLGGPVRSVEGRLFEPAGAPVASAGVTLDLLLHLGSVVQRLFHQPLHVTRSLAARHPEAPAESYSRLEGQFDLGAGPIAVKLEAARDCPAEAAGKELWLSGPSAALRVDLAADVAELVLPHGERRRLYPGDQPPDRPDARLVRQLLAGDLACGLTYKEALTVFAALELARRLWPRPLPTYDQSADPRTLTTP